MKAKPSKKVARSVQKFEIPAINEQDRADCVHRLNSIAEMECQSGWLEKGKLVIEYRDRIKADPNLKKLDAFKLLAAHADSLHQAQQLRHFAACYELHQQYSGDKYPNLTMTHWVAVLGSAINKGTRQLLLEKANEGMSVSQLKEAIRQAKQPQAVEKQTWDGECKRAASLAARLFSHLSSLNDVRGKSDPKPEPSKDLVEALKSLADFMAKHFDLSNRLENASGSDEAVHA